MREPVGGRRRGILTLHCGCICMCIMCVVHISKYDV